MGASAIWDVQKAVYRELSTDVELLSLCPGGVHDGTVPPEGDHSVPYIVLDSWTEDPQNRLTGIGRNLTFVAHVWSSYDGNQEAALIVDRVSALLENKRFPAGAWNITTILYINTQFLVEADGMRHFAVRFRVTCQPIPA